MDSISSEKILAGGLESFKNSKDSGSDYTSEFFAEFQDLRIHSTLNGQPLQEKWFDRSIVRLNSWKRVQPKVVCGFEQGHPCFQKLGGGSEPDGARLEI